MDKVQTTTPAGGFASRAREALRAPGVRDVGVTLALTLAGALAAVLAIDIAGDYVNLRRDRVLMVLIGLGVAILALPSRQLLLGVGALTATWIVGRFAYVVVPDQVFIDTPVQEAVGGAAYYGTPYLPGQLAAVLLMAVVLLAGIGLVLVGRRRGSRPFAPEARAEPVGVPTSSSSVERGVVWIGVALLALTVVPNLTFVALGDPLAVYKGALDGTWDPANLMTWQWLIDEGAVPMKDFFWPYGQTWVFDVFPLGPVWEWLANCGILALAAWALWRLAPAQGRAVRVLLCVMAFLLVAAWAGSVWRYSVPLVLALVYAGVGPARHRTPTGGHLVLALAALNAALWGIDLLIYGLAGMACVLIGEVLSGRVALRPVKGIARGLLVDALAMASILIVPLLWVLQDAVEGNLRFVFGLRGVSAASALVQDAQGALKELIGLRPTYEMISVMAPALLLAAGLVHSVLGKGRSAAVSPVLLAAGGVSFAILLKHLVRIQYDLMFLIPMLAGLWSAILAWESRRWVLAAAVGALGGTLVWMVDRAGSLDPYLNSATESPSRLVENLALADESDRIAAVDRRQFTRANLPAWPTDRSMAIQLQAVMRQEPEDSFAVLGDLPYVYIYFDERPPYHVQLYDASRLDEQEAMVEALEKTDPELILWRRDFVQDGVPQAVRTPLVMKWAAERYVPVRRGDPSDVLRRRAPGEDVAREYWRSRLGEPLPLGFVPASSDAEDAEQCASGDGCNAYAVIEGDPTARGQAVDMTISGRGQSFAVQLLGRPGEEEYPVRLDRLWFASLVGPNPAVDTSTPGFEGRLERRRSGDDLW
jgi:hypothetical protein